jgi:hypothetical protein
MKKISLAQTASGFEMSVKRTRKRAFFDETNLAPPSNIWHEWAVGPND